MKSSLTLKNQNLKARQTPFLVGPLTLEPNSLDSLELPSDETIILKITNILKTKKKDGTIQSRARKVDKGEK